MLPKCINSRKKILIREKDLRLERISIDQFHQRKINTKTSLTIEKIHSNLVLSLLRNQSVFLKLSLMGSMLKKLEYLKMKILTQLFKDLVRNLILVTMQREDFLIRFNTKLRMMRLSIEK